MNRTRGLDLCVRLLVCAVPNLQAERDLAKIAHDSAARSLGCTLESGWTSVQVPWTEQKCENRASGCGSRVSAGLLPRSGACGSFSLTKTSLGLAPPRRDSGRLRPDSIATLPDRPSSCLRTLAAPVRGRVSGSSRKCWPALRGDRK